MKRLLSFVLALVMMAGMAHAQFRYGLRLGGDIAMPHGASAVDVKGGSGFAGGLTCEWQAEECGFAAGLSLLYDRRPVSYSLPGVEERCKIGKDFITVPVDFKYKFWLESASELAGPFVVTGPDLAVRMGSGCGSRLHAGWNFGVGFDVANFMQLSVGWRQGLGKTASLVRDNGIFINYTMLFDI